MDMGTQGSGRKRLPNRERLTAEDDALNQIAREAEARLAAKRAARAEAREIRMKELERQQKEEDSERYSRRSRRNTSASDEDERMSVGSRGSLRVEERPEKDFTEKGSRSLPGLSAAALASLGGTSRRGSGDTSISVDTEASIREIKDSLAEVEEKYKKAMVSNAQLDNEKTNFLYQVDTLKDMLLELEEQLAESRRQYDEKNKEFEREKHAHSILQFQFAEAKEALKRREELLEKHGIVLNSELATNGETSDTLNDVGHQRPSKITKEELNALRTAGDGTLGRASEVEVKSEIVENVGKKEILQNTEQEQHKEDPAQECMDTEVFHPGGNAKDQKASEDSAPSLGVLADATNEEQAQNQILENASFLENTEQVESNEVINTPDDRTGASLEQSECLRDGEIPGPGTGQDSYDALDIKNHSKESAENQEDLKTHLGEGSTKPCQESASLQPSEVGGLGSADTGEQGGSPTEDVVEAGLTGLGEQVGTEASGPPTYSDDHVSPDEECAVEAPAELDPSAGQDLDKELPKQEAAEPQEPPSTAVGGENDEKEEEERGLRDEKPTQTEVQNIPRCPEAESSLRGAAGPAVADAESKPLDVKEPKEEKNDQQGEALDSSQKKTKNKKKNKKKKTPVPVETLKDAKKELTFQNSDLSEVKDDKQVALTDKKPVVEAQNEVTESPEEKSVAGSGENVDCPENPRIELDKKLNREDNDVNAKAGGETADGGTLGVGGDTIPSSGTSASDKDLEEAVLEDGAAPGGPPEPGSGVVPSGALPESEGPSKAGDGAPQTGSTEQHEMAGGPSQEVKKVIENDDLAPTGELGASTSEGRDELRGESEKGRSKEDCTMS
ncbi:leucine-rich repeat flightless-interacting protein 1 isoform X33 [Zalophus californianus]|uniref:Leucine-rich repeat flightless-interacting protein 1 isoform X33 n=1 Tax=Zalophus californianus TaxID=9704 RepID=A0A6J2CPK2_ZALCA|nr:leucine-rich repeat flightless-interacting protein 1 isoform X33 [Zalophus californianus]